MDLLNKINLHYYPRRLFYPPEWLVLGVNNICNLHCKMCDVGINFQSSVFFQNLMGSHPINMPLSLFHKIADQAKAFYPNVKLGYAFTEPLIYPDLISSLDYANHHDLYTSITTNGLTLRTKAEDLVKAGLNEIFVSLDGPPEVHNHIRGHKNSFERAIQGIEALGGFSNPPRVSIYCTITQWNVGHLVEFAKSFQSFELERIGFMHTNYTNQEVANQHNEEFGDNYPATSSNMEELDLENMDLKLLEEEVQQLRNLELGFPIDFSPDLGSASELNLFYHEPGHKFGKRCNDVFRAVMIKSDGSVIPAHGRCYNLTIGNLYANDLRDIWNSTIMGQFRSDLIGAGGLMPACSRCCSAF